MEPFPPENIIATIWNLRFAQRNQEALRQYSLLKLKYAETVFSQNDYTNLNETELVLAERFLPVRSSMARLLKSERVECEALVGLFNEVVARGREPNFYLQFEIGIHYFHASDYQIALDYFFSAEKISPTKELRLACLVNIVSSLDQLGQETSLYTEIINTLEKEVPNINTGITAQSSMIKYRAWFRVGQVNKLLSHLKACNPSDSADQTTYYAGWVASLPYCSTESADLSLLLKRILTARNNLLYSQYRARTLMGLQHTDDDAIQVKPSEIIERLYLWVWQWLVDPAEQRLTRIMALLPAVDNAITSAQLTAEDECLLDNALNWLCLFDKCSEDHLLKKVSSLKRFNRSYDIYSFEKNVIAYLKAKRDGNQVMSSDIKSYLQTLDLWHSQHVFLWQLVEPSRATLPSFENIADSVRGKCSQADSDFAFRVSMTTFVVEDIERNERVISEELASLMSLIKFGTQTTAKDIAFKCFRIRRFDAEIHTQKVANLLHRARIFLNGKIGIKSRLGTVIFTGNRNSIFIEQTSNPMEQLRNSNAWREFVLNAKSDADRPKTHRLKSLLDQPVLNRKQIEDLIGKSRSSANRILKEWEDRGLVIKQGKARNTTYRTTVKFAQSLHKGHIL